MSRRTKKVGSAGRFGSRYGRRVRKVVAEIEKVQRAYHLCPNCNRMKLKRDGPGIWKCRKCGVKIVGGAYRPVTDAEKIVRQALIKHEAVGSDVNV